jgi:hypothetical protein
MAATVRWVTVHSRCQAAVRKRQMSGVFTVLSAKQQLHYAREKGCFLSGSCRDVISTASLVHYRPNFLNNTAERRLVRLKCDTLSLLLDEQQPRTTSVYPLQVTEFFFVFILGIVSITFLSVVYGMLLIQII